MVEEEHIYRVKDAIADLMELDPELPLALSSDEEGNNVRMVNSIGVQLVRELEYQYMETVCEEDIESGEVELDGPPVKIAEVW
ncbi:hypothetical protein SEA_LUCKYSOCKE_164 [Streptomyces phage LuckySocke]|nr:hypothetical protein SEA_ALONE_166 [Streptomyces phage Alone3]WPH58904.1 hypothetical protein SEA_LUCKYSOCKE_164 [Streptomyces phage LuckySocke]